MSVRGHQLLAFGPRVAALLVLIASLLVAPLRLPAAPDPCCCPRPARCTCSDHNPGPGGPPSIRRCTPADTEVAPAPAPVAALPTPLVIVRPAVAAVPTIVALASPHRSPDLDRPRGPS